MRCAVKLGQRENQIGAVPELLRTIYLGESSLGDSGFPTLLIGGY